MLAEFDVEVDKSMTNEDGTIDHDVSRYSVIGGLATAMRDQIASLRAATTVPADAEQWLTTLAGWAFENREEDL